MSGVEPNLRWSAFVTEINAAGTATIYSTFLGGSSAPADYTAATAIAVDAAGSAYLTGYTTSAAHPGAASSPIQPVNGGGGDAFVTKLNPSGSAIVYSTYLGGSASDIGKAIALDAAGNAYVTGITSSTTFTGVNACALQPTYESNSESTFVTEINAAGTATAYSTYLGDTSASEAYGIAADAAGNAYLTGSRNALAFVVKISGPGRVFFTLAPCRVFDTRGGTPMSATEIRSFQVSGVCGIQLGHRQPHGRRAAELGIPDRLSRRRGEPAARQQPELQRRPDARQQRRAAPGRRLQRRDQGLRRAPVGNDRRGPRRQRLFPVAAARRLAGRRGCARSRGYWPGSRSRSA